MENAIHLVFTIKHISQCNTYLYKFFQAELWLSVVIDGIQYDAVLPVAEGCNVDHTNNLDIKHDGIMIFLPQHNFLKFNAICINCFLKTDILVDRYQ